jgi:hypothetical protein
METPDYIICLECESPVYVFDWDGSQITDAICTTCGNSSSARFSTEEDYGEMMAAEDHHYGSTEN